jgi:hypothetical protein
LGKIYDLRWMIFDLETCVALPRRSEIKNHTSSTNWRGVPVLPRSHRVLEAPLRRLAPAARNHRRKRSGGFCASCAQLSISGHSNPDGMQLNEEPRHTRRLGPQAALRKTSTSRIPAPQGK